ncbi:MAG TPA: nucleotidyltransferase family protein [Caulobacteraceae bacterium]
MSAPKTIPKTAPKTAMVLAAGLGLRLRPMTEHRPKALVEVGGKALIDHALDGLRDVGVERAVVNVHAFADMLEDHLKTRRDMEIVISDERALRLETGGGVKNARALLGDDPIWVANSDYAWISDDGFSGVARAWDPDRMDVCVIVVPKARTLGFDTAGDFSMDSEGRLTHRGDAPSAPLHCFGVEILDPAPVYADPRQAFSLFEVWMRAQGRGRLFGVQPDGVWMQAGDPASLAAVQDRLVEEALRVPSLARGR